MVSLCIQHVFKACIRVSTIIKVACNVPSRLFLSVLLLSTTDNLLAKENVFGIDERLNTPRISKCCQSIMSIVNPLYNCTSSISWLLVYYLHDKITNFTHPCFSKRTVSTVRLLENINCRYSPRSFPWKWKCWNCEKKRKNSHSCWTVVFNIFCSNMFPRWNPTPALHVVK